VADWTNTAAVDWPRWEAFTETSVIFMTTKRTFGTRPLQPVLI
jgi:hypothetical protein